MLRERNRHEPTGSPALRQLCMEPYDRSPHGGAAGVSAPVDPIDPRIVTALATPASHTADDPTRRAGGSAPPGASEPGDWRAEYPAEADADSGVEHVQTHLSHVFLTRSRVYKLRKAVHFDFVDFSSRRERNADCIREIELNRRLAPDVYLGLAAIHADLERIWVGQVTEPPSQGLDPTASQLEHCVVMRRLPAGHDALSLLERGKLERTQLETVAQQIARFHAENAFPPSGDADRWIAQVAAPVEENFETLAALPAASPERTERLERIEHAARAFLQKHAARFADRFGAGLCVNGHGDLHLQHVWFVPGRAVPEIIDCVEFCEDFRRLDPANEVAFLAMDLRYRGRRDLAEHFLARYALESDDYDLYGLVDYFISYRAMVRAKVAALAGQDPELEAEQRERTQASVRGHLELAEHALDPTRRGELWIVSGPIGSGKSSVARALERELRAVVVVADRVRKRLAGMAALERTHARWQTGIFGEEMSDRTYQGLQERARPALVSGRNVVLDASFSSRTRRDALRAFAETLGLEPVLVRVTCAPETSAERLAERRARSEDASDAAPEHLTASLQSYDPPDEWPAEHRLDIATDAADWQNALRSQIAQRTETHDHAL